MVQSSNRGRLRGERERSAVPRKRAKTIDCSATSVKFLGFCVWLPVRTKLEGDLRLLPELGDFTVPTLRTFRRGDFSRAKFESQVHLKNDAFNLRLIQIVFGRQRASLTE